MPVKTGKCVCTMPGLLFLTDRFWSVAFEGNANGSSDEVAAKLMWSLWTSIELYTAWWDQFDGNVLVGMICDAFLGFRMNHPGSLFFRICWMGDLCCPFIKLSLTGRSNPKLYFLWVIQVSKGNPRMLCRARRGIWRNTLVSNVRPSAKWMQSSYIYIWDQGDMDTTSIMEVLVTCIDKMARTMATNLNVAFRPLYCTSFWYMAEYACRIQSMDSSDVGFKSYVGQNQTRAGYRSCD